MKKGLVLKTTGKFYDVLIDGKVVVCSLRGKIRLQGLRTTNPSAAGDYVDVEMDSDGNGNLSLAELTAALSSYSLSSRLSQAGN